MYFPILGHHPQLHSTLLFLWLLLINSSDLTTNGRSMLFGQLGAAVEAADTSRYTYTSFEDETEQQRREDALTLPPCEVGFFQCDNGEHCVKQQYNCDNVDDCSDGSDELNCTDSSKANYYNQLFSKRPDEDRESSITDCSLTGVPYNCTCSAFNIFCVNLNFESVPYYLDNMTKELDMSGNRMRLIRGTYFPASRFNHLTKLILTKSEIEVIMEDTFGQIRKLESLYLIGNKIVELLPGLFVNNTKMKYLYLSHNPIKAINEDTFKGMPDLRVLDLRYCKLTVIEHCTFRRLPRLEQLWLQRNSIYKLEADAFVELQQLDILSLSFNRISSIHNAVFFDLKHLKTLSLSSNLLYSIDREFEDLLSIEKLDISHNRIESLTNLSFFNNTHLISLDLRSNRFKKLPGEIFENLTSLDYIYFDDFKLCSYAQNVRVCHPRGDGISSVNHLLDNAILRVSVWIVALIACVGNVFVLIGRLLVQELNEVHSFFIKNLAMADFLMGVYLFTIAYYDVQFRNEYIRHETQWRASLQCQLSGIISTISSEASVLILVFITTDRYLSIMKPFSMKRRKMTYAIASMIAVWVLSFTIAILPLLATKWFSDEFYGNNGVCLALQIHDTYSTGWEYSFAIFCVLNMAAFGFIAYAYILMAMTIMRSGIGLRSQQKQDRNIARRCGFIVMTDGLCWLPIVVIKFLALFGIPINQDLYAWVAVFLLPVNSALNPVLYTLTTKIFKQHFNRFLAHRVSSRYHHGRHPSASATITYRKPPSIDPFRERSNSGSSPAPHEQPQQQSTRRSTGGQWHSNEQSKPDPDALHPVKRQLLPDEGCSSDGECSAASSSSEPSSGGPSTVSSRAASPPTIRKSSTNAVA